VGDPERVQTAYLATLKRWPNNQMALMGVGNTAYRMKNLAQAEAAFRQVILKHPDSVPALNNLAQTLADQERYADGLPFAQRAVELGGPLMEISKSTLAEIEIKLKQ
jgi:tetratricopeptide (TPR) repeat protein